MLTITLDESDCFAAWVSAKDAGFSSPDGSDPKREFRYPSFPPSKREGGSVLFFATCSSFFNILVFKIIFPEIRLSSHMEMENTILF